MAEQAIAVAQQWGVLDEEGFWMGDENGPRVFADVMLARVLATVLWEQFEHKKEFRVEPFTSATRLHDTITAEMDGHEAYLRAEGERPRRRRRRASPTGEQPNG